MNFFIMHLALADLSVGLLSVSTDIVWKEKIFSFKTLIQIYDHQRYKVTTKPAAINCDRFILNTKC